MALRQDVGVRTLEVMGEAVERSVVRVSGDGAPVELWEACKGWRLDRALICAMRSGVVGLTGRLAVAVSVLVQGTHRVGVAAVVLADDVSTAVTRAGLLTIIRQPRVFHLHTRKHGFNHNVSHIQAPQNDQSFISYFLNDKLIFKRSSLSS